MEIQKSIDVIAFYEIIEELDQCLRLRFPEFYSNLLPGLTEAELLEFEAELGVTLPEDYKILYGWKNGGGSGCLPFWYGWFPEKSGVIETSKSMFALTRDSRFASRLPAPFDDLNNWWDPRWILLIDYEDDLLCLDLVSSFNGIPGQIIRFIHDDYCRTIEYRSLYRWLQITVLVLSNPENYDEDGEFDSESGFAMARAINGYPVFFPEPLPSDLPNCFTTP